MTVTVFVLDWHLTVWICEKVYGIHQTRYICPTCTYQTTVLWAIVNSAKSSCIYLCLGSAGKSDYNIMHLKNIIDTAFFFTLFTCCAWCEPDEGLIIYLQRGIASADMQMKQIEVEWEIESYPSFLLSCGMTKTSWEMLKTRLQTKILNATTIPGVMLVVSYMVCSNVFTSLYFLSS